MMSRALIASLAAMLALAPCGDARAAGAGRSQSSWTFDGAQVTGWLWFDAASLESFAPGPERSAPATLGLWLAAEHAWRGLAVSVDGRPCAPVGAVPEARSDGVGGSFVPFVFECPPGARARVRVDAFFDRSLTHVHVARVRRGATGPFVEGALWSGVRTLELELAAAGPWRRLRDRMAGWAGALGAAPLLWVFAWVVGAGDGSGRRSSLPVAAAALAGGLGALAASRGALGLEPRVAALAVLLLVPWPGSARTRELACVALVACAASASGAREALGLVGLGLASVCARALDVRLERAGVALLGGLAAGAALPVPAPPAGVALGMALLGVVASRAVVMPLAGAAIERAGVALAVALGVAWCVVA